MEFEVFYQLYSSTYQQLNYCICFDLKLTKVFSLFTITIIKRCESMVENKRVYFLTMGMQATCICKVDVDCMSIILARCDEMRHGVPIPDGVAEFHVFDRDELLLQTRLC